MPNEIENLEPRRGNQHDWEAGLPPAPQVQPAPAPPPPDYYTAPATAKYQLSPPAAARYSEFLSDLKSDQELGSFLQIFLAGLPFLTLFIGGPAPMTPIEIATSEWELIAKSAAGLPNTLRVKYRDRCYSEATSVAFGYTPTDLKFWRNFCEVFEKRPAPPPPPPQVAPNPPAAKPAPPPYEPAGDPTGAGKGPRPGAKAPPANSPAAPSPAGGAAAGPSPVAPAVPPAPATPGWRNPA